MLADRWVRIVLLALGAGGLAFLTALAAILYGTASHQPGNALFVYGP